MTRHTSRLLRSPYSPTIFSSASLIESQFSKTIDVSKDKLLLSGRRILTDERIRRLEVKLAKSLNRNETGLLTTPWDLVGFGVLATVIWSVIPSPKS